MDFQEFSQQNAPQRSTSEIISHAFNVYKGILLYAVLAMVIYIVASFIIQAISGFNSQNFLEIMKSSDGDLSSYSIWAIPGLKMYYGLSFILGILLAPLYVGIIYIANKNNLQQPINFSDLFIGYRQNFVNIIIYSIISNIILGISFALCFIPGFLVLPLLMLGYPILLFENATFMEALTKSINIAKENYGVFFGTTIVGFLISLSGILLCFIGIILTVTFILVVMYSLYCAYLGKPRPLDFKN